jgi:hypothetical protein
MTARTSGPVVAATAARIRAAVSTASASIAGAAPGAAPKPP